MDNGIRVKLEFNDYKERNKGILIQIIALVIVIGTMNWFSFYTRSGDVAFQISLAFVVIEGVAAILQYCLWYQKVSLDAAKYTNIKKKRQIANDYIQKYLWPSVAVSLVCIMLGIVLMFFKVIFVDIDPKYRYGSIVIEALVGNVLTWLLMKYWCVPNIVTGV